MLEVLTIILLGYMSIEDMRTRQISLWTVLVLAGAGSVSGMYTQGTAYLTETVAAVIMGLITYTAGILSDNGIGSGDAWVISAICMCIGWSRTLTVLFYAVVSCCICGIICIRISGQNKKMQLPFLPFLFGAYSLYRLQEYFMT